MASDDPTSLISADSVMAYIQGVPDESRQFDFLLGEWELSCVRFGADGSEKLRYKGFWKGTSLHNGRMLLDEFSARLDDGTEISSMATLRSYCPANKEWVMTFLVSHEPNRVSCFNGTREGDEMHLSGEGQTLDGDALKFRVRFYAISESSFEWENRVSLDGGATWWRDSTLSAVRKKS